MKPSTFLTAGEASRATGKSIPTITRNVKNGKIANSRKGDDGEYEIDPIALFNRYPKIDHLPDSDTNERGNETPNMLGRETPQNDDMLDLLRSMMSDLKSSHEALLDEKDETISSLKTKLNETKALTDQRTEEAKKISQELEQAKVDIELTPKITRRKLTLKERIFGGEVAEVEEVA